MGGDGGPDTGVDACAVGNEGCACTSGGVCNPGLECLSKLCVNPNKDAGPDSSPSDGGAGDAAPCADQPPFADPIAAVPCTAPACLVSDGGSDYVKCESNGTTCTSTDNGIILACSAGSSSCNSSQVCCLQGANTSGSCPTLAAVVSGTSVTACQSGTCPTGQIQLCNTTAQCKTGSCVYGALVLSGTKGAYLGLCQ